MFSRRQLDGRVTSVECRERSLRDGARGLKNLRPCSWLLGQNIGDLQRPTSCPRFHAKANLQE